MHICGLWIDKPYWGQDISSERAHALIDLGFSELNLSHIRVGCLESNIQSRKAIEKYISEYGGIFYGVVPVSAERYEEYPESTRPHYEYAIREKDYRSDSTGITCNIPGITYQEINLKEE